MEQKGAAQMTHSVSLGQLKMRRDTMMMGHTTDDLDDQEKRSERNAKLRERTFFSRT